MRQSDYPAARAAAESVTCIRRLAWAERVLPKFGGVEGVAAYWRENLYGSVDGRDLEMCAGAKSSYNWMLHPGRIKNNIFIEFCRLRSGSLLSAVQGMAKYYNRA